MSPATGLPRCTRTIVRRRACSDTIVSPRKTVPTVGTLIAQPCAVSSIGWPEMPLTSEPTTRPFDSDQTRGPEYFDVSSSFDSFAAYFLKSSCVRSL